MTTVSIRAYEQKDLPLVERLSSLARRFNALKNAEGITPFQPDILHQWIHSQDDVAARQTGLLLLQVSGYAINTPFNVLEAMSAWNEDDRQMFINFLRIWDF